MAYGSDGPPGCHFTLKHHSLDPYGGLEMVPQQLIWWYGCLPLEIWLCGCGEKMPGFQRTAAKNKAWPGSDGPPGCHFTLKHHSLDPHGGLEMVPQQLIWWYGCIPLEIWVCRCGEKMP
jgi:hypothetical protein